MNQLLKIAAGNGVKAEYSRLGCDTDKIQNDYILWSGLKMLAIALAGTVCAVACGFWLVRLGLVFQDYYVVMFLRKLKVFK